MCWRIARSPLVQVLGKCADVAAAARRPTSGDIGLMSGKSKLFTCTLASASDGREVRGAASCEQVTAALVMGVIISNGAVSCDETAALETSVGEASHSLSADFKMLLFVRRFIPLQFPTTGPTGGVVVSADTTTV